MSKICLSVFENSTELMWKTIQSELNYINMVELRIDALDSCEKNELSELIKKIKKENLDIVWTVRWSEESGNFKDSEAKRLKALLLGDQLKVDWVDIEYNSKLWKNIQLNSAKLILSYHNFDKVDDNAQGILINLEKAGADIVKIAFAANSTKDLRKVCELYNHNQKPLIAIAMGEYGECSRILPAVKNLPWTYASCSKNSTAPGQLKAFTLKNLYRFDKITEKTKIFCVIGDPVSHSLSPYVHNSLYVKESIDAVYVKIHVDEIEEFYKVIDIFNIEGVSATVPHKESILSKANADHWLHKVGAANTMAQKENKWVIDNTDIAAAIESIQCLLQIETPKVLILGAGGAAKGLAWGMTRKGWKLTICNRSIEKAEHLCNQLKADILGWEDRNAHGFDVVVNCTTLGMQPNEDTTPMEFEGSHTGLIAFDTVYTPEKTLFLKNAKEVGAFTISGREMFYRQAAFQHGLWFGEQPPFEAMSDIMERISEAED